MGEVINIRQVIDAGGSVEGNKGAEGTKNLQVYTTDSGKKRLYSTPEAVPKPNAGVKIDTSNGNITVDIPEKWKDDEQVKKYIDNYMLQTVSSNYKVDKNVEYQDPFDETKKIKTEEWIQKLNDALQFRVQALNATAPTKTELINRYGGTDNKNKVINDMTTDDIIIMSANFKDDDSWVPIPAYMALAYPELEKLESYTNGWVKKKDYLDNFYNIESGKITEKNAYGIASTPEKMLSEVEDMSPEEIAKTVAFGNFIHQVDPKRSNWQQFLQASDALHSGFTAGTYDWFVETSDLITSIAGYSTMGPGFYFLAKDNPVDTRGFWNGLIGLAGRGEAYDVGAAELRKMEDMALTNKDALSKAQAGYVQGRLAGQAVDTIVSMVAVGEATKALSNFITTRITSSGAVSVADKMANASTAVSSSTALTTPEVAEASSLADMAKNTAAFKNAAAGSGAYQAFFKQTLGGALDLYSKSVSGATVVLGAMDAAKFANVVNSAARIATAANFANTAVSVLGNMVFAAVVGNKELTTKVLTSNATSDEAKTWLQQMVWETGEITALSYATNLAVDTFGRPLANSKAAEWVRNVKQKASQKFTGFTERLSTPWLNFMQWYNNNRAAAAKATTGAATNARAAQGEAIKEAILANEARAYGAHLSTEPGSYGARIVEEALRSSGVRPGVTMSETLENLARAGIVFDPANLNLSEYEAWQSSMAGLRVAESNWGAIDENISQVVHEFSNPDIYPIISEQLSEVNKANSAMLQLEEAQGLLSKPEIKSNKSLLKKDEGFIYANHSKELSRYIVRGYELRVIANEGRALGHQNLEEYKPYVEARTRLEEASKGLAPRLREIADKEYVPALANAERNIIDVMVNDGAYPRAFVEAMRASGKFGIDGKDWLRLVARQDTPKGAYTPFSGTVKEDNTISINKFKVLDDEDITWPGNGLQKLIEEYGISRAEKALVKAGKQATGKTTEIVVSGEKTRSAGLMKEFKGDFLSAVKQGIKSFVQTASGTVAIGKTRSAEQSAFLKEVADIGGVETIDIDSLRAIMKEKGLPMAEDIVDQESLDKFLSESSEEARKLIIDAVGEKMGILERDTPYIYADEIAEMERDLATYKLARGTTSYSVGVNGSEGGAKYSPVVKGILEKYGFDTNGSGLITPSAVEDKITGRIEQLKSLGKEERHITKEDFEEIWKNNPNIQKILRGELEKTSLQTGYGISDTRARLNAQVPGFDVLDWSLLGREHVDGLIPGGFYSGMDDNIVKAYILSIDDLKKLLNLPEELPPDVTPDMDDFWKHINTEQGNAVIPLRFQSGVADRGGIIFYPRGGNSMGGSVPNSDHLHSYLDYIHKELGIDKVPVAIKFSKHGLTGEAKTRHFFDALDEAIATGKKPKITEEDVYFALRSVMNKDRLIKRIRSSVPESVMSDNEIEELVEKSKEQGLKKVPKKEIDYDAQIKEVLDSSSRFQGIDPKDITHDVQKAFSEYGKIPFFRGQKAPLGSMEYNDPTKIPDNIYSGAGDAYWLSPNASYTDSYGDNKLVGTIPVEYFMSDKEKEEVLGKLFDRNEELYNKKNRGKKLTKKEQSEFDEIHRIVNAPSGSGADRVDSYRALAEYTGKPVIDISEDGFANGTAFFYYKGVNQKFDEEIGKQLETQAKGSPRPYVKKSDLEKGLKSFNEMGLNELIDDITDGYGFGDDWYDLIGSVGYTNTERQDMAEINDMFYDKLLDYHGKYPNTVDVMAAMWQANNPKSVEDIDKMTFQYDDIFSKDYLLDLDAKDEKSRKRSHKTAEGFLVEMNEAAHVSYKKPTASNKAAWEAINPQNLANVPTEPEFKQPRRVTYEDYERGLAEDAGLDDVILEALKNEQFNKFSDLKNTNNREYENLLDKLDRANAKVSNDVKQSGEVQLAAEEYRKNIKDFENAVLFNQKFSYMIKAQTSKNTMTAFAEKNGITLPEGKGSAKNKMKSALWQMLVDGKELPAIKGLKKTDIKNIKNNLEIFKDTEESEAINKQFKKNFYKMLDETDLFKNAGGPNPLKYELDEEAIYNDIDEAIGDMITRIKLSPSANAAIEGIILNQGYQMSEVRYEFTVLDQILSKEMKEEFSGTIKELSRKIVDNLIPKSSLVIKGNIGSLYKKVETAINDKLEARFATAKTTLESMGEEVESATITQLLEKYNSEIKGASEDPTIIKTMDENGEIQYERVSPTLASIYNERPTYSPMSTPMKVLNNLAILKKINQTDFSPRSFAKQSVSDPAMAFATVGALPGTLHAIRDEIASHFGPALLRDMEQSDSLRFNNIKAIADREGISMEEAFKRNSEAIAKTQVPFTLLNNELLRQAKISKFGNDGVAEMNRRTLNEKINDGLRKASDKLGFFQNKRETYVRLYSGEKAFMDALRKGYNLEQAENFREYALNTATTNFRTKHSMFNMLRSTVPYLTSGISGAKSFWQMFELDPIGVTSRIFSGFVAPILYFAGEIFSDENLKKKYEALAESEKENHIVIAIGGELILIPVGEEIGEYTNIVMHAVENMHEENQYEFWSLMLNDLVSLIPGADFTGFTDPEMWGDLSGEAPTFLEVMDNGIAKMLSGAMPPVVQSMILGFTGRDLYTGRKIDTSRITIDENGNPVIMSYSTSQFAKALANMVGGDAKVIERVVSGTVGTVALHVLDTLTSAVQFVVPGGENGSLTTGVEKALSDLSAPFTTHGYNSLERRWNYGVAALYREKEKIEKNKTYIEYNKNIASEKDAKKRQTLINKRNEMFSEYIKKVEALVKGYRAAGGNLDKWNFSKAVSLITFEDAIRADRQFMDINTNYSDAYKQAMQTLYNMGVTNPEGPSSLGYIYTDDDGKPQLAMWTPAQMQIMQNQFYEQGNIHAARIKAIIDNGKSDSLKKQREIESDAEQPYWDKYNATGKLSSDEWDAIDDLRKAYNAAVVLGLKDYMDAYGASSVLSNDAVIDYLRDVIKVPSSYEKVKGRYVSSRASKLNKQDGFAESYIKAIFGVK